MHKYRTYGTFDLNIVAHSDGIISETMKSANKLVKDRKKGNTPQEKSKTPPVATAKSPPVHRKTGKQ